MTISKTPRADLKRIVDPHAYALLSPDSAKQEAARIQRAMSTDMPPMPEPIERETWRDVWADVRGVVLCAAFVLTVLAFGAHVAGLWGA